MLLSVTLCYRVLLCVTLYYLVLPCVTFCYPMLSLVTLCCRVLPRVTLCYPVLPIVTLGYPVLPCVTLFPYVTLCYPVLPFVTLCYPVLLFVTLWVVTETWLARQDHRFTPVGSCPRQKSSDLRPNHLFTKFKRKVLTCLRTKAIVNCNHNAFMRWLEKTFICNRRCDVAWQLSRIKTWNTCLEEVSPNILKETAKYRLFFFTLWLGFYPSFMFKSCKTETVNRNRRLFPHDHGHSVSTASKKLSMGVARIFP